ncbi:MAG: hypothetical protein JNM85_05785 [Chthonomonas sp.]|nr:hypothetical protein [Chthonomonas sp.]
MFELTPDESQRIQSVMDNVRTATLDGATIKLPPYDPDRSVPGDFAGQTIGIEPNPFGGTLGAYRYQFEGEEDLLHLIVTRLDFAPLTPEEGQAVCGMLMPEVSTALIWFKPGQRSQHFYLGHDELVRS